MQIILDKFFPSTKKDLKQLLKIIYQHLKPGGRFLLDVFSLTQLENFQESQTWEVCPDGGFWYPENYIALNRACKYPDNVTNIGYRKEESKQLLFVGYLLF